MQLHRVLNRVLLAGFVCACTTAFAGVGVDKSTGGIESLKTDGKEVKIPPAGGGFRVYDAVNKKDIALADGSVAQSVDKTVFSCEKKGDIRLAADFIDKGQYILVSGYLENLKGDERGMLLDYRIPFVGKDIVFSNSLNESVKVNDAANADGDDAAKGKRANPKKGKIDTSAKKDNETSEQEGNVFPVAAMCNSELAIAMAIPPSDPREFGMVGSAKGLTIRFYLGTSPTTKKFPNRAPFVFIIYPVEAKWGFRSALSKYYSFYPDYYNPRTKSDGLGLQQMPGGAELPDIQNFGVDWLGAGASTAEKDFERDKKNNIIPYTVFNIGAQELSKLPKVAATMSEAVKTYEEICTPFLEEWTAGGPEPTACELIDSSTCQTSAGKMMLTIRFTGWGGNSITFTENPNPDLFGGKRQCVGSATLKKAAARLAEFPGLQAVLIDSCGANFPAHLNYRKEHFEYARFPLTCDPNGRVALHNTISHYEGLDALRKMLREQNKFLFANGIYSYKSRDGSAAEEWISGGPEHYRGKGVMLGRFFIASLLDGATSEAGLRAGQDRYEFYRTAMGRKLYFPTNATWEDANELENYFNKCVVYSLFATNVRHYNNDVNKIKKYYPDYYNRDMKLRAWFVPNVRILSRAGWEPTTYATATGQKVLMERYGSGKTVYLAVMSEANAPQKCVLTVDMNSLGFKDAKYPQDFSIEDIAHSTPLKWSAPNNIEFELKPFKTCIVAISKKG